VQAVVSVSVRTAHRARSTAPGGEGDRRIVSGQGEARGFGDRGGVVVGHVEGEGVAVAVDQDRVVENQRDHGFTAWPGVGRGAVAGVRIAERAAAAGEGPGATWGSGVSRQRQHGTNLDRVVVAVAADRLDGDRLAKAGDAVAVVADGVVVEEGLLVARACGWIGAFTPIPGAVGIGAGEALYVGVIVFDLEPTTGICCPVIVTLFCAEILAVTYEINDLIVAVKQY
jgi:hypothetical protein